MSMFRSFWNYLRVKEGSGSRDSSCSRDDSRSRNASRDTETTHDPQAVRLPLQNSDYASDSNTDSMLTFHSRQRISGLNIILDDRGNSEHANRAIHNNRYHDTMSDFLTYLREEPSTASSRALHIENYTTYASDLKEKVEEPRKYQNSANTQEHPVLEENKYKTITIRTLSKSTRDKLTTGLIEDPDDTAGLKTELQNHETRSYRMS